MNGYAYRSKCVVWTNCTAVDCQRLQAVILCRGIRLSTVRKFSTFAKLYAVISVPLTIPLRYFDILDGVTPQL